MLEKFHKINIKIPVDIREILKKMKNTELELITEFFTRYTKVK